MSDKTIIIIPAFNEAGNIKGVIECIKKEIPYADILVVDDGSIDATAAIAQKAGAEIISLPFNLGPGAALQTGFKYAFEKGYKILVRMDADGQHEPRYIDDLLSALEKDGVDVVIGSRFLGKHAYRTSFARRAGMILFGRIASVIIKQKVTDPTSGFRAMNRKVMEFFSSDLYPMDYPDADVIILLHLAGFRVKEVPVVMYPSLNKKSIHAGYKPLYYIFKMCLSILMTILREKPKKRR